MVKKSFYNLSTIVKYKLKSNANHPNLNQAINAYLYELFKSFVYLLIVSGIIFFCIQNDGFLPKAGYLPFLMVFEAGLIYRNRAIWKRSKWLVPEINKALSTVDSPAAYDKSHEELIKKINTLGDLLTIKLWFQYRCDWRALTQEELTELKQNLMNIYRNIHGKQEGNFINLVFKQSRINYQIPYPVPISYRKSFSAISNFDRAISYRSIDLMRKNINEWCINQFYTFFLVISNDTSMLFHPKLLNDSRENPYYPFVRMYYENHLILMKNLQKNQINKLLYLLNAAHQNCLTYKGWRRLRTLKPYLNELQHQVTNPLINKAFQLISAPENPEKTAPEVHITFSHPPVCWPNDILSLFSQTVVHPNFKIRNHPSFLKPDLFYAGCAGKIYNEDQPFITPAWDSPIHLPFPLVLSPEYLRKLNKIFTDRVLNLVSNPQRHSRALMHALTSDSFDLSYYPFNILCKYLGLILFHQSIFPQAKGDGCEVNFNKPMICSQFVYLVIREGIKKVNQQLEADHVTKIPNLGSDYERKDAVTPRRLYDLLRKDNFVTKAYPHYRQGIFRSLISTRSVSKSEERTISSLRTT